MNSNKQQQYQNKGCKHEFGIIYKLKLCSNQNSTLPYALGRESVRKRVDSAVRFQIRLQVDTGKKNYVQTITSEKTIFCCHYQRNASTEATEIKRLYL